MNHSIFSRYRILMPLISRFLYLSACTRPHQPADPIALKIQALLQQMTLDEKVGQMNQYNGFWEVTGPASNEGNANMNPDQFPLRKFV